MSRELNYILVCVFKQIVFYLSLFLKYFSAQKDYGIRSIADCSHPRVGFFWKSRAGAAAAAAKEHTGAATLLGSRDELVSW